MQAMAAFERFVDACRVGDQVGARAVSTDESWRQSGESARRMFEQAAGVDLVVTPSGPLREREGRAALPAFVGVDERQHLWFLLRETSDEWRIDGFANGWDLAGLFLYGHIERPPAFAELDPSEPARQWFLALESGHDLVAGDDGDDALALLTELRSTSTGMSLARTVGLPGTHRYAAAIAFEQQDGLSQTIWALLEGGDAAPIRVLGRSFAGSVSQLVRGVDLPWPPPDDRRAAPSYTADEATQMFEQALDAAHHERSEALGTDSPLGGRMGDVLRDLFETLIDPEQRPDTPRAGRNKAGTPEERLAGGISDALASVARGTVRPGSDDVRVDAKFVRDNGSELVRSLVSAFTDAVVPKDLSVDLPQDGGESRRMRIDVGDLLSGLFAPAPEVDDDDEDDDEGPDERPDDEAAASGA